MKRTFLVFALIFLTGAVMAQNDSTVVDTVKLWNYNGQINFAFSQVSLTNWAAGGDNSFSGNGLIRLEAVYAKDKSAWDSYILAGYGVTKIGGDGLVKNDDKLEILSKYGYKASKNWKYSVVINGRTQFSPGYKDNREKITRISDFMAPGYLTASLGMDYKPKKAFALFLSPVTAKFTFVEDDSLSSAGAYGVDPGKRFRSELGGFIKMIYNKENIVPSVNVNTTVDLFTNYLDHPERIDVNWDLLIAMKVNKFLSVTINTQLIYDYDIKFVEIVNNLPVEKAKVQFKEVFGVGFSASF